VTAATTVVPAAVVPAAPAPATDPATAPVEPSWVADEAAVSDAAIVEIAGETGVVAGSPAEPEIRDVGVAGGAPSAAEAASAAPPTGPTAPTPVAAAPGLDDEPPGEPAEPAADSAGVATDVSAAAIGDADPAAAGEDTKLPAVRPRRSERPDTAPDVEAGRADPAASPGSAVPAAASVP
jgi:hypothetical protein